MRNLLITAVVLCCPIGMVFGFVAFEEGKPKHTTKVVMAKAHKSKLLNKVIDGDASAAEKVELLDLYISLAENKPKKGDAASWKEKTSAIVLAASKAVVGREGAGAALKASTNCGACHKAHK